MHDVILYRDAATVHLDVTGHVANSVSLIRRITNMHVSHLQWYLERNVSKRNANINFDFSK